MFERTWSLHVWNILSRTLRSTRQLPGNMWPKSNALLLILINERTQCTILSELRRAGYKYLSEVDCCPLCLHGGADLEQPPFFVSFLLGNLSLSKKDCQVPFLGHKHKYVEASEDAVITNDMSQCTRACISRRPSGNLQGSLKCFDLLTYWQST